MGIVSLKDDRLATIKRSREEVMNSRGDVVLLHLSDLHRTPGYQLTNSDLLSVLRSDLKRGFLQTNKQLESEEPKLPELSEIDFVVVSGDLTQHGRESEFTEAFDFLATIANEFFNGDRQRIVVVPGNHDIDWDLSRGAYREASWTADLVKDSQRDESENRLQASPSSPTRILYERARTDLYQKRLEAYAHAVTTFYQQKVFFPLVEREQQFAILDRFTEKTKVVIVGFNSCDLVDHLWPRGKINREAILRAGQELDRRTYPSGTLRIAVWHHNLLGTPGQSDFMDPRTASMLASQDFCLGLHGHVHEAGRLDFVTAHSRLPVVWAGSFCAGAPERPPSVPMLYNVVGINTNTQTAWVHVRARKHENEPWGPNHDWGDKHKPYYKLNLENATFTKDRSIPAVEVYQNIEEARFVERVKALIQRSSKVTFVGTGLTVLQNSVRELIVARAKEGKLNATICFGNPFSPHVRARLTEEERCAVKPDVAAQGIISRVKSLLHQTDGLAAVRILLFNNYPTMSIFRFDDEYVYYNMGYRKLGNECPALWIKGPSVFSEFLDSMIQSYLEDAVEADEEFKIRVNRERNKAFIHPAQIRAVGLYAVAEPKSEFYKAGARLLGYDVFGDNSLPPNLGDNDEDFFRRHTGDATQFGFHLTIADVMYLSSNQLDTLRCEVKAIASEIDAFQLSIDEVAVGEFGDQSIALKCSDASGRLERLLCEVAVRIRPLGLGTNYSLDPLETKMTSLNTRDRFMLDTYQSPFVFGRFSPHFTLCTPREPLSDEELKRLVKITSSRFSKQLQNREPVIINRLYLFSRPLDGSFWNSPTRDDEIHLK